MQVQEERKTKGVCLKVNHNVKRKRMGGTTLLAHKKFAWWSKVSELGRGKEEGVNN
jgi:hypothetical protein